MLFTQCVITALGSLRPCVVGTSGTEEKTVLPANRQVRSIRFKRQALLSNNRLVKYSWLVPRALLPAN